MFDFIGMDGLVGLLEDVEKLVSLAGNIILAIYGIYTTIRASRWKQTSEYLSKSVRLESQKVPPENKAYKVDNLSVMSNTVRFAPKHLKKYVAKVMKREFNS